MEKDDKVSPVAKNVLKKCGGAKVVSSWVKINLKNVYCWTYSRSKGGTGGIIPAQYHPTILDKAVECGIDLGPEDFFETHYKIENKKLNYQ